MHWNTIDAGLGCRIEERSDGAVWRVRDCYRDIERELAPIPARKLYEEHRAQPSTCALTATRYLLDNAPGIVDPRDLAAASRS